MKLLGSTKNVDQDKDGDDAPKLESVDCNLRSFTKYLGLTLVFM